MKVVYVEWVDAQHTQGVLSRQEAETEALLLVRSAGLLVGEDEGTLRLAEDYWSHVESDGTVPETYRHVTTIPKILIKRQVEWETDNKGEKVEGADRF